ncbi:hypothetical protein [Alcanivorax sp. IL2]|uniref:hypothetical protein n=1 Tax=Alcanivorax sp. IL2 TaxID=3396310 RepID=UPI0039C4CE21
MNSLESEAFERLREIKKTDIEIDDSDISISINSIKNEICNTLIRYRRITESVSLVTSRNLKERYRTSFTDLVEELATVLSGLTVTYLLDEENLKTFFKEKIDHLGAILKRSKYLTEKARAQRNIITAGDENIVLDDAAQAKSYLNDIRSKYIEVQKLLDHSRKEIIDRQLADSALSFSELYCTHKRHEENWFWAFFASCFVMLLIVTTIYTSNVSNYSGNELLMVVFKKILLISAGATFMKVTYSRFQSERNLGILYNHRQKVLQQYKGFEAAIGDDSNAKNEFRLEIAKYIFSDPGQNKSSDVDMNSYSSTFSKLIK